GVSVSRRVPGRRPCGFGRFPSVWSCLRSTSRCPRADPPPGPLPDRARTTPPSGRLCQFSFTPSSGPTSVLEPGLLLVVHRGLGELLAFGVGPTGDDRPRLAVC